MIEVFHSSSNQIIKSKDQESQINLSRNTTLHMKIQNRIKYVNLDLNNIDHVSSNVRSSRFGAMLYVFDDNRVVIKMILQGRSPTKRRVSRIQRVALNWILNVISGDIFSDYSITWISRCFLVVIFSYQNAESHVQASVRKYSERRFDSDESEIDELGSRILLSARKFSPYDSWVLRLVPINQGFFPETGCTLDTDLWASVDTSATLID